MKILICLLLSVSAVFAQIPVGANLIKQPPPPSVGGVNAGTPTAFWTMNQATGTTRSDSIGTMHFTDDSEDTPAVSGKLSNAASLDASTQSFYKTYTTDMNIGANGFTVTCWFQVPNINSSTTSYLINRSENSGSGDADFSLLLSDDDVLFYIFYDNSGPDNILCTSSATVSANTWHFVVATWDRGNSLLKISVDGGAFTSVACGVTPMGSISGLYCGIAESGGPATRGNRSFYIDAVGFWKNTVFTADNVTYEYNGGTGRER